jgi:hypothetical protein
MGADWLGLGAGFRVLDGAPWILPFCLVSWSGAAGWVARRDAARRAGPRVQIVGAARAVCGPFDPDQLPQMVQAGFALVGRSLLPHFLFVRFQNEFGQVIDTYNYCTIHLTS